MLHCMHVWNTKARCHSCTAYSSMHKSRRYAITLHTYIKNIVHKYCTVVRTEKTLENAYKRDRY